MNFLAGHIFREVNTGADLLATKASISHGFYWWDSVPCLIATEFNKNKYDFTNYI